MWKELTGHEEHGKVSWSGTLRGHGDDVPHDTCQLATSQLNDSVEVTKGAYRWSKVMEETFASLVSVPSIGQGN